MNVSEKSTKPRAIVIGGSIAGLFVGAFLRRIGWQVDIDERSSIELIGRGVGIFATHLELLEALDKCGAVPLTLALLFTSASRSTVAARWPPKSRSFRLSHLGTGCGRSY